MSNELGGVGLNMPHGTRTYGSLGGQPVTGRLDTSVELHGPHGDAPNWLSRDLFAARYGLPSETSSVGMSGERFTGTRDAERTLMKARQLGYLNGPDPWPLPVEVSDFIYTLRVDDPAFGIDGSNPHPLFRTYNEHIRPKVVVVEPLSDNLSGATTELQQAWNMRFHGSEKLGTTVLDYCLIKLARTAYPKVEVAVLYHSESGPMFYARQGLDSLSWGEGRAEAFDAAETEMDTDLREWNAGQLFKDYLIRLSRANPTTLNGWIRWWGTVRDDLREGFVPPSPSGKVFGVKVTS